MSRLSIKKISPRTSEIMRRQLAGDTNKAIAATLGISVQRVSAIVNSPLYRAEKARIERAIEARVVESLGSVRKGEESDGVIAEFEEAKVKAAQHIVKLMLIGSDRVSFDAARDILDRRGYKAPEKSVVSATLRIPDDQMEALRNALKETG